MNKPTGKWKCRNCNTTWNGSNLYQDPRSTAVKWTCGDLSCGGTCDEVAEDITLRPLTENEKLILEYIRQHTRCTVEDILNFMVPFQDSDELRAEIAGNVGYLIYNGYVEKNRVNSALIISDTPPK